MKKPEELTRKQLEDVVGNIQAILYLDIQDNADTWDPDKGWDVDFIEMIAQVLGRHGLVPEEKRRYDEYETKKATKQKQKVKKATKNVWVYYNSNGPDYEFDKQLDELAEKHGGRSTGSGYGAGERAVSFKFEAFKWAKEFKAEAEAITKVDRAEYEE